MNTNTEHINIFIAYSRKDAKYLDKLRTHFSPLELSGTVKIWYDGEIAPGTNWEEEIKKYLLHADITLLLISANSFNSDYFYHKEMTKALKRHQEEEAIVIPVILSDCMWEITDLKHLQALPKDGKPIDHWTKEDSAYADIVRGVYRNVELIRDRRNQSEAERKAAIAAAKKAEQEHIRKEKEAAEKAEQERKELERIAAEKRAAAINAAEKERRQKEKAAKIVALPTTIQDLLRDMIHVQGGTFQMGDEEFDWCKPVHTVTLDDFKIGKYPITQAQYQAVTGENPSYFKGNDKRPVEHVSWYDAEYFIQRLNELTGEKFRLPTEAEWEFAARGGTKNKGYKYAGSNDIDKVAWYYENSYGKGENHPNYGTNPVGTKAVNELNIHDMTGNVWEWCEDWYSAYSSEAQQNPTGAAKGTGRVLRGGGWYYDAGGCRVSNRDDDAPDRRSDDIGFRLVSPVY